MNDIKAGPKLDEYMATEIMEWHVGRNGPVDVWVDREGKKVFSISSKVGLGWNPSTDILQAIGQVARRMVYLGHDFQLFMEANNHNDAFAHFQLVDHKVGKGSGLIAEAICLAASRAIAGEVIKDE